MKRRLREEHDHRGRDDDAVRDDAVLEIGRRHGDECRAEEARDSRVEGQAELPHAAEDEQAGRQLDERVANRDRRRARAAAAAQQRVGKKRNVVVPRDLRLAAHAGRRRPDDRAPKRKASRDDVEEAPEGKPGREEKSGSREVHRLCIGRCGGRFMTESSARKSRRARPGGASGDDRPGHTERDGDERPRTRVHGVVHDHVAAEHRPLRLRVRVELDRVRAEQAAFEAGAHDLDRVAGRHLTAAPVGDDDEEATARIPVREVARITRGGDRRAELRVLEEEGPARVDRARPVVRDRHVLVALVRRDAAVDEDSPDDRERLRRVVPGELPDEPCCRSERRSCSRPQAGVRLKIVPTLLSQLALLSNTGTVPLCVVQAWLRPGRGVQRTSSGKSAVGSVERDRIRRRRPSPRPSASACTGVTYAPVL